MRRLLLLLVIPLTCAAAIVITGVGPKANPHDERAALEDAERRLDSFAPPPGAEEVPDIPGEAGMSGPGEGIDSLNFFHVGRTWIDPEPVRRVKRWLEAAAPPGSRLVGTGTGGDLWSYSYWYGDLKGIAKERRLEVAVIPYGKGSALRADAIGVWVEPRSASERIPAGVRTIEVEREVLAGGYEPRPTGIVAHGLIRSRSEVASIIALVDGFEPVQPGVIHCPLEAPRAVIRLRFLRRVGGAPVAVTAMDWPLGPCQSLALKVEGEPQPDLSEGWILHRRLGPALKRLH